MSTATAVFRRIMFRLSFSPSRVVPRRSRCRGERIVSREPAERSPFPSLLTRIPFLPLLVLALAGIPFGLVLYFTGPNSGWRGAWWIRLPRRLEELLPQIQTALQDAGLSARPTRPGPKSRWLRNTQVSLELDRGICIWLLPGVPGSRAGLSPRLQPLTTLVITGLTDPSNNQSDHLREVLQRAGENPTWGP